MDGWMDGGVCQVSWRSLSCHRRWSWSQRSGRQTLDLWRRLSSWDGKTLKVVTTRISSACMPNGCARCHRLPHWWLRTEYLESQLIVFSVTMHILACILKSYLNPFVMVWLPSEVLGVQWQCSIWGICLGPVPELALSASSLSLVIICCTYFIQQLLLCKSTSVVC